MTKLSKKDMEEIIRLRKEGYTLREIAERFNVTRSAIYRRLKDMREREQELADEECEDKEYGELQKQILLAEIDNMNRMLLDIEARVLLMKEQLHSFAKRLNKCEVRCK